MPKCIAIAIDQKDMLSHASIGEKIPQSPESITSASRNWAINKELGFYQGLDPKNVLIQRRQFSLALHCNLKRPV